MMQAREAHKLGSALVRHVRSHLRRAVWACRLRLYCSLAGCFIRLNPIGIVRRAKISACCTNRGLGADMREKTSFEPREHGTSIH